MTSGDEQLPTWSVTMVSPELELRVGAPREETLGVLARHLDIAGFKTKDATPTGFRAVHFARGWILVGETSYRTELLVRAEGDAVTVAVGRNARNGKPRRLAARGLNAALDELRSCGVGVHWTPWAEQSR
ncbi:formylmethanofuran dehydrogenase subunit B [Nocardioides ginsengisegetis]|uniref:Formylmethanofuran dehydrogenase subunit B n=1 Tax=Nocardioides ginsengisegetis TaxID=661491 RepID=A0A7W3J0U2_9ACTN|nr:hypothetical protein [Nocardioides ginsengisegetis]MBA8804235.1 formylmethanofuran dehydrogenase subunit B [Nocardioides ginsengisegetis]